MITDIPSASDFEVSGIAFLNLAWDAAIDLLLDMDHAEIDAWDDDGTVSDEYWKSAQMPLCAALALAVQGTEMLLKARITEASPFLILLADPKSWPSGCDKRDISFSEFKTIDAQDLIRTHNAVVKTRLTDDFKGRYEKLRRRRNTIMHTVDKKLYMDVKEILIAILETTASLVKPKVWVEKRSEYLENMPLSVAGAEGMQDRLFEEFDEVIAILSPSEVRQYFDFDKKWRRYLCRNCQVNCEAVVPNLAQLDPNNPKSEHIRCLLCGERREVIRRRCTQSECRGNVIDKDDGRCLTCGKDQ